MPVLSTSIIAVVRSSMEELFVVISDTGVVDCLPVAVVRIKVALAVEICAEAASFTK